MKHNGLLYILNIAAYIIAINSQSYHGVYQLPFSSTYTMPLCLQHVLLEKRLNTYRTEY